MLIKLSRMYASQLFNKLLPSPFTLSLRETLLTRRHLANSREGGGATMHLSRPHRKQPINFHNEAP